MIDTLSKIYQFSGKMQGTMKKTILFSVLHSLFDMMSFGALVLVFSGSFLTSHNIYYVKSYWRSNRGVIKYNTLIINAL